MSHLETMTEEEIAWAKKDHPQLGDMLDELNQRCRSYVGFSGMTLAQAQQKALKDFEGFYLPGEYMPIAKPEDQYGPFFVKVGDEQ